MADGGSILSGAAALLGLVSTAVGVWIAWDTHQLKREADILNNRVGAAQKAAELAFEQSRAQRDTDQFTLTYNMTVYKEVVALIEEGDLPCGKQRAVNAFIQSLRDSSFKAGMADAVKEAGSNCAGVAEKAAEIYAGTNFDLEQRSVEQTAAIRQEQRTAPASAYGWDYDVFWCEANPANRAVAEKLSAALAQGDPKHGRIRVRPLPTTVNDRAGYGVRGYEIRAERQEQEQALLVKPHLEAAAAQTFTVTTSGQSTPWYISVFACATAG